METAPVSTLAVEPATPPALSPHEQLMQAADIPQADWPAVEWTVQKESSWQPTAVEPTTGACHLEQSLPCGKDHCETEDEVCQLHWANEYVLGRYGSWQHEVQFHKENGYY